MSCCPYNVLPPSRGHMAADIFAKLGDIKGESIDDKHKDEIEVFSFSWGVTNSVGAGSGGGGGAGKVTFKEFSIVHSIDKASPSLLAACATGMHLKEATITQRKAGKGHQDFLIFKMNDVIIASVAEVSGAPQSETVTREVTVDEAVAFGILLQQNDQLAEAGDVFRLVLQSAPNHPAALHYAGVLAHQQGRSEEALTLIRRSLALAPDQADCYSNLGIVLQS